MDSFDLPFGATSAGDPGGSDLALLIRSSSSSNETNNNWPMEEPWAAALLKNITHTNTSLHESLQLLCSSRLPNFTRPELCNIDLPPSSADNANDMSTLLHVVAILVPVLFGLIVVVGLFGNMLVVVVVAVNQQMRSTTNILSKYRVLHCGFWRLPSSCLYTREMSLIPR
jgi:hypothetical protein